MKKSLSILLTVCMMLGLFTGLVMPATAAQTNAKTVAFDEDNVVLSFGAVSDIHILGSVDNYATKKYTNALTVLKEFAGGKLDAITVAGDISNSTYNADIGETFKTVTDAAMGENANVFFVTGNHDAQNNQWSTLNEIYETYSKYTAKDLPSSRHDRGNRHMVINGYHYIGVNMMDYWNTSEAMFADEDLEWLAQELAAARADAPGQPIFVYTHAGIYGTTYGSDLYTGTYWGSKKIYSYLENYPEVVTFSGHLHFPVTDDRTIYQKDFTSINCGSVQYMSIEGGYLQTGSNTTVEESSDISTGLLVQVDKHHNLKITRIDFANGKMIKEPLYVAAPDMENETHLLSYNDDYFNLNNTAPIFAAEDEVYAKTLGSQLEVTYNAAEDDDMVHHYILEIKGKKSGTVQRTKILSEFYFYPTAEDYPESYTMLVPYTPAVAGEAYELTLYAVDSLGLTSEPITYDSSLVTPPVIVTEPKDVAAKDGEEVTLTVKATGKGLTYKWYYKYKEDDSFSRAFGWSDATYTVEMSKYEDGYQAYCVITNREGMSSTTRVATLTLKADPIKITTQPKTTYAKEGATAKVSVTAKGNGLKYQWYVKNSGASKYTKSSVKTATYSVKMDSKVNGRRVYCVITDKDGNKVQTNTVILRRQASITSQPSATRYAKKGAKVSVKVTAVGDGLTYTWYVKNSGASKYSKSSVKSATYSVKMDSKVKGRRVYCVVKDKYGKTVQSKTFILRESVSITSQPKTVTVKKNATAKLTLKASGDGLKYTWYVKTAGAKKFTKVSGSKSTYSVKMTSKVKNCQVYCVVTDKYGNRVKTNTVKLKMK